jgi:hypothetical protein
VPGIDGAAGGEHDEQRERGDNAVADASFAAAVAFGAAEDVVGGDAQKPGHHLGKRELFSVALLARVGRQHLDRLIGDPALIIERVFERGWEALGVRIAGRAVYDQRDHRALRVARLEEADFFRDVFAARRGGRADHDQGSGRIQRRQRLVRQGMPGGEVVAVTEDGPQRCRDGAGGRLAAGQILVDAEAFQAAMQPFGPCGIGVTVGDKGAVAISDGFSHGCLDPMLGLFTAPLPNYPRGRRASQLTVR